MNEEQIKNLDRFLEMAEGEDAIILQLDKAIINDKFRNGQKQAIIPLKGRSEVATCWKKTSNGVINEDFTKIIGLVSQAKTDGVPTMKWEGNVVEGVDDAGNPEIWLGVATTARKTAREIIADASA